MRNRVIATAAFAVVLMSAGGSQLAAQPHIIPIGSAITFGGTNSPDTYHDASTFGPNKVLVDNGKVQIWQEQIPTGPTGEWDIFHMKTVNGGPLASDVNAYWDILIDYTLSAPVAFDQVSSQWYQNGQVVGPLYNFSSICCATTASPVFTGWAYYNSGFNGLLSGPQKGWKQIYGSSYSIFSQGGINVNTVNEFAFALHFTLQGLPTVSGVISAGDFGAFPTIAPGTWIEIYGSNMAGTTQGWTGNDFTGNNAPTALGGTKVTIGGQNAFVSYVSSGQVNVQVPSTVPSGRQPLVVISSQGASQPFNVTVADVEPGLLSPLNFKINGIQYAKATFADGVTYVLPPNAIPGFNSRRARPGDTIILYGIGFGSVTPDTPAGTIATGLTTLNDPLRVTVGGTVITSALPYYGLAPNFVGLYQFNLVVPSIPASDNTVLTFTLNNTPLPQQLAIAVGN